MRTEQEIVLRKKTFIVFSLFILTCAMGILNFQKGNVLAASNSEIKKVYNNYTSTEELFKVEVVGDVQPVQLRVKEDDIVASSVVGNTNWSANVTNTTQAHVVGGVVSRGAYVRETNLPPTDYEKVVSVRATAYCLCQKCCGKSPSSPGYGHTASGLVIIPGRDMKVISVDPSVIPLGSQVYVEGYGYAIAADTGGAIKGNKIDVYKDTHALALQWGVKNVNVYILKDEEF